MLFFTKVAQMGEEARGIYAEPAPELRKALGLSEDELVQVLKAWYGLTNAPRMWFEKVDADLRAAGPHTLEPCPQRCTASEAHYAALCLHTLTTSRSVGAEQPQLQDNA
jgi:hypothetical protein